MTACRYVIEWIDRRGNPQETPEFSTPEEAALALVLQWSADEAEAEREPRPKETEAT